MVSSYDGGLSITSGCDFLFLALILTFVTNSSLTVYILLMLYTATLDI